MQPLCRSNHRRREDRGARAMWVLGEPIVGKGIGVAWWTGIRNRIRRNPREHARYHALGSVRLLQAPLVTPIVTSMNEIGGSKAPAPSSRL